MTKTPSSINKPAITTHKGGTKQGTNSQQRAHNLDSNKNTGKKNTQTAASSPIKEPKPAKHKQNKNKNAQQRKNATKLHITVPYSQPESKHISQPSANTTQSKPNTTQPKSQPQTATTPPFHAYTHTKPTQHHNINRSKHHRTETQRKIEVYF